MARDPKNTPACSEKKKSMADTAGDAGELHAPTPQGESTSSLLPLAYGDVDSSLADLEHAVGLDPDGYLRIVPNKGGTEWYLSWNYSRGKWRNHYVMAVADRGRLECLHVSLR